MDKDDKKVQINKQYQPEILDDDTIIKLSNFINDKAVSEDDGCPVCGSHLNTVSNTTYSIAVSPEKGVSFSNREMPAFSTVCHNCGYIRFFNRIVVEKLIEEKNIETQGDVKDGDA